MESKHIQSNLDFYSPSSIPHRPSPPPEQHNVLTRTHIAGSPAHFPKDHHRHSCHCEHCRPTARRCLELFREPIRQARHQQDPRFLALQEQEPKLGPAIPVLHGWNHGSVDRCGSQGHGSRYVEGWHVREEEESKIGRQQTQLSCKGVKGQYLEQLADHDDVDFLVNMSASADVLAMAKVEVDLAAIPEGKNVRQSPSIQLLIEKY